MITFEGKPTPKQILPFEIEEISKMNAFDLLYNCNKDYLDAVAITYSADLSIEDTEKAPMTTRITYRQLFDNISRAYYALLKLGVKKGDIISFCSITTPELIYTAYASVLIGSIFDVVDVRLNTEQLKEHFESEPSKVFFAPKPFIDKALPIYKTINAEKIVLIDFEESLPFVVRTASKVMKAYKKEKTVIPNDNIFISWNKFFKGGNKAKELPKGQFDRTDIISLSHTTGTTGIPKALMHTNENWNAQVYNAAHCGLDLRRGEKIFNCTVPWVDFGLINAIHTFLCLGIEMNLDPLWKPKTNANYIIKYKPQWWMGAPGWLDDLFANEKYKDADLQHIRYLITGGAPLYPHKHILYQQKLKEMNSIGIIAPGFGLSEATAAIAIDTENKEHTVGRMWPLVDTKIVNPDTFDELKKGEAGELIVSSKSTMLSQISPGYYKNEAETKGTFIKIDGRIWVRTGDKFIQNSDDTFSWQSRYKNILTYNGYNIHCEKIAAYVEKMKDVSAVVIIGCVTDDGNQMPIICVETAIADTSALKKEILSEMEEHFPDYYKPRDIVFYEKFPTISMKTDIRKIKSEFLNEKGEYIN